MPILATTSGRKGTKDDSFLPSIHGTNGHPRAADVAAAASPRKAKSNDESTLRDHATPTSRVFTDGKKLYSSAPTSESSTPFKLPSIHRKSNSVTNLAVDKGGTREARGERFTDRRGEMTRSPSCPSVLEKRVHDNLSITPRMSQIGSTVKRSSNHKHTVAPGSTDNGVLKLPNIFKQRDKTTGTSVILGSTPRANQGPVGPSGIHPEHETTDSDNNVGSKDHQRSRTQIAALLLPISPRTQSSVHAAPKSKRKRKKRYDVGGVTVTGSGGSVSETLLKEKLMAIERRDRAEQESVVKEELVNGKAHEHKDALHALDNAQGIMGTNLE